MKLELERIISALNPWFLNKEAWESEVKKNIPERFIQREFLKKTTKKWESSDKVHLIVGPRQCGKSTAVWKHLSTKKGRIMFLNCEERLIRDWCTSPSSFVKDIKEYIEQVDLIFFEEAQHLEEAGIFLKGLVDKKLGIPILVTGSSSYHLHSKTRESLAGRATRSRVTPLTLGELIENEDAAAPKIKEGITRDIIERQLKFGCYPGVWLSSDKEETLFDLIEAFVIRDASDIFRIKNLGSFRQLLKLIAWQIGDLANFSEWGAIAGIDHNTVKNYIEVLEESGIVQVVHPFAAGKRAEITSTPIVYFVDIGLRNASEGNFTRLDERVDRGKVFQNWVFAELYKMLPEDVSIRFWRSKSGAEVDFVLVRGKKIYGVEVKCSSLQEGKITRSARSFIEVYKPEKFFIINRGYKGKTEIKKTQVCHILPGTLMDLIEEVSGDMTN